MSKTKMNIWGREVNLETVFDCYEGEQVLDFQKKVEAEFVKKATDITNDSLSNLKEYCLKINRDEIGTGIDNIFRFVMPKSLFIKRTNKDRIVALMCAYKFNPDDGIALVFKNGELFEIGTENIII